MREVRTAFVTLAASGPVVAAVPGKQIDVLGFIISALGATNVKFQSGGGADISLTMACGATGGYVAPADEYPWGITTASGEALNLNMSAATTVGVQVKYALVG